MTISAYFQLAQKAQTSDKVKEYTGKQELLIQKINYSLNFAKNYQEMNKPRWQNINETFIYAVSHLDSLTISQKIVLNGLEIFADPLLDKEFFHLMENVIKHGVPATEVDIRYQGNPRRDHPYPAGQWHWHSLEREGEDLRKRIRERYRSRPVPSSARYYPSPG